MICERNVNLPQKIDIASFRQTDNDNGNSNDARERKAILHAEEEYKILPKVNGQYDYLDPILSLRRNQYLACRWNQFLDNVPNDYVHIYLYKDYKKQKSAPLAKRKSLNGQFYGVDNKLAPIPIMPDRTKLQSLKSNKSINLYSSSQNQKITHVTATPANPKNSPIKKICKKICIYNC